MKEKIYKAKVVAAYERAMALEANVTDKLNSLLSRYFDNFFDISANNAIRYKELNGEWKQYCHNINRLKKVKIPVVINAFETEVAQIIEKNPQFNQQQND